MSSYWTDVELKLELSKNGDSNKDGFLRRLDQLLFDMRLKNESVLSLLKMIEMAAPSRETKGKSRFVENLERITFDTRLDPEYSDEFIRVLKKLQAQPMQEA
jgi:hypothetical protein